MVNAALEQRTGEELGLLIGSLGGWPLSKRHTYTKTLKVQR